MWLSLHFGKWIQILYLQSLCHSGNFYFYRNQVADYFFYIYALVEIIMFYPKQNQKTNDKLEGGNIGNAY